MASIRDTDFAASLKYVRVVIWDPRCLRYKRYVSKRVGAAFQMAIQVKNPLIALGNVGIDSRPLCWG